MSSKHDCRGRIPPGQYGYLDFNKEPINTASLGSQPHLKHMFKISNRKVHRQNKIPLCLGSVVCHYLRRKYKKLKTTWMRENNIVKSCRIPHQLCIHVCIKQHMTVNMYWIYGSYMNIWFTHKLWLHSHSRAASTFQMLSLCSCPVGLDEFIGVGVANIFRDEVSQVMGHRWLF